MDSVEMRFTKWGGGAHWHFPMEPLGRDDHGSWFMIPPGTPLQRGVEPPISKADGFVMLVPDSGDWIAVWNHLDEIAVYVDVTTSPRLEGSHVTAVDLDLDVVRWRDGRVEVLDVEEFEEHRISLAYPAAVIESAERTAARLADDIAAGLPPFDGTGGTWLEKAATHWRKAQGNPQASVDTC